MTAEEVLGSEPTSPEFTILEATQHPSDCPRPSGTNSISYDIEYMRWTHYTNPCLPLALLIQYTSTLWMAEMVHEQFPSAAIHHSCVSKKSSKNT